LLGAGLGWAVWWVQAPLAVLALLPVLTARLGSRMQAAICWLGYFGAGLWPLVSAADDYFNGALWLGMLGWALLSLLFAGVWCLAWSPHGTALARRMGRLLAVLALSLVPPLGAVSYIHPLLAAGSLLPGSGFAGLGVLVVAWAVGAARPARWGAVLLVLGPACLLCHLRAPAPPLDASRVQAVSTRLAPARTVDDLLQQVSILTDRVRSQPDPRPALLVFPESAVQEWRPSSEDWVRRQLLPRIGEQTLLFGTTVHRHLPERINAVAVLHQGQIVFLRQRQPMVLGMWAPWRSDHYAADWGAPGVWRLGGQRVAVRVCAEELLLALALLDFAVDRPELLVTMSNHAWSRHPWHDQIQAQHTQAVAALFGVPYVRAVNRSPVDAGPKGS